MTREGEQEFATIHRNRSGIDSGRIDYGLRVQLVEALSGSERGEIVATSAAMHESICRCIGLDNIAAIAAAALETEWRGLTAEGWEYEVAARIIREVYFGRIAIEPVHQIESVDDAMRSSKWGQEWVLRYGGENGLFYVLDGGMPMGVQIVAVGTTAADACQKALARD